MRAALYVVTNKKNGKQYVGMTTLSPEQRWQLHCSEARSGGTRIFCRALRKYGRDGFDWDVVATASDADAATDAEKELIRQLRPAYNMTEGGEGAAALHPIAVAKKSAGIAASWERPDVRAARKAGLQAAAQRIDQDAKGRKVSASKSQPERREKAREQSKARVAADGGAQIRAALAHGWADPDLKARRLAAMAASRTPEYRARLSVGIRHGWRKRRVRQVIAAFELDLRNDPRVEMRGQ